MLPMREVSVFDNPVCYYCCCCRQRRALKKGLYFFAFRQDTRTRTFEEKKKVKPPPFFFEGGIESEDECVAHEIYLKPRPEKKKNAHHHQLLRMTTKKKRTRERERERDRKKRARSFHLPSPHKSLCMKISHKVKKKSGFEKKKVTHHHRVPFIYMCIYKSRAHLSTPA